MYLLQSINLHGSFKSSFNIDQMKIASFYQKVYNTLHCYLNIVFPVKLHIN